MTSRNSSIEQVRVKTIVQSLKDKQLRAFLNWAGRSPKGRVSILRSRITRLIKEHPDNEEYLNKLDDLQAEASRSVLPSKRGRPRLLMKDVKKDKWKAATDISFPRHPDVRFKPLPFYSVLSELVKPTTIEQYRQQLNVFIFHMTPQQTSQIRSSRDVRTSEYTVQVLLRFCLLETTSAQDDCYPPNLSINVNQRLIQVPNYLAGCQPVDVTDYLRLDPTLPNSVQVASLPHYNRYVMAAYLVLKENSEQLLTNLRRKGLRVAFYTKGMIQQKLKEDADSEIATTHLRVSLVCPLGKMRITTPCRALTCDHVQCFDASLYLLMNERKQTWRCPVCDKTAYYENLIIDEYFVDVLKSERLPMDCKEIQLLADGNWSPLEIGEKEQHTTVPLPTFEARQPGDEVELASSDEECEVVNWTVDKKREQRRVRSPQIVEIDLISSSESADESSRDSQVLLPLKKRRTLKLLPDVVLSKRPTIIELDSDSSPHAEFDSESSSSHDVSYRDQKIELSEGRSVVDSTFTVEAQNNSLSPESSSDLLSHSSVIVNACSVTNDPGDVVTTTDNFNLPIITSVQQAMPQEMLISESIEVETSPETLPSGGPAADFDLGGRSPDLRRNPHCISPDSSHAIDSSLAPDTFSNLICFETLSGSDTAILPQLLSPPSSSSTSTPEFGFVAPTQSHSRVCVRENCTESSTPLFYSERSSNQVGGTTNPTSLKLRLKRSLSTVVSSASSDSQNIDGPFPGQSIVMGSSINEGGSANPNENVWQILPPPSHSLDLTCSSSSLEDINTVSGLVDPVQSSSKVYSQLKSDVEKYQREISDLPPFTVESVSGTSVPDSSSSDILPSLTVSDTNEDDYESFNYVTPIFSMFEC